MKLHAMTVGAAGKSKSPIRDKGFNVYCDLFFNIKLYENVGQKLMLTYQIDLDYGKT